jgi:hypothetical protein
MNGGLVCAGAASESCSTQACVVAIPACANTVSPARPDDCYNEGSAPLYAQGLETGTKRQGPEGKTLILSAANGFKIWKEDGGTRILNATGRIANGWQKKLTRPGTAFSAALFTEVANIVGRACPPNVFLSHGTNATKNALMKATGRCLYYDSGYTDRIQPDRFRVGGVEGSDYFISWNRPATGRGVASSYYEGNVKFCADKGMRLPVVYESSAPYDAEGIRLYGPRGDALAPAPIWAGRANGVPAAVPYRWGSPATMTATAMHDYEPVMVNPNDFWAYEETKQGLVGMQVGGGLGAAIRCVLPSN